jgi:hypothetical protein
MTIITGIVCDNTCLSFAPGDNTPDIFDVFGTPGAALTGPFTLNLGTLVDSLTIDHHTFTWSVSDLHFSIVTSSPLLASFSPGAVEFIATGLVSPGGFAGPETEFLCPVPGVPEPATWLLMLAGLGIFAAFKRRRTT